MYVPLINALADLFWPPRCAACGDRLPQTATAFLEVPFCEVCAESLMPATSPHCSRCALPFDSAGPDHLCLECLERPPPFKSLTAVYQYGGAAADAVLRLKYGRMPHLGSPMGRQAARAVSSSRRFDVVIPVPLYPKKLRARGFNQSALIGQQISRTLKLPMDTSSMLRVRDTAPQAGLSRKDRLENIRGAFVVKKAARLSNQRVLLVDDVVTTATTVREASRVLVKSGARSVDVAAFARAGL